MAVRVGIIGAGVMGADHARIIANDLPGAELCVVCDANADRARTIGDENGAADVSTDPTAVVERPDLDAVLIASPDATHAELTLGAIHTGKYVLCEKPLASTSRECLQIVAAEARLGKRLIQTGFMRRFDPSYVEMKTGLEQGMVGRAIMMHNFHRNVEAPDWFTGQMAITNSAPHEFDIARFVLGTEYVSISAFQGVSGVSIAPVIMVLETVDGQLVSVEVNVNAAYGYDVRGELIGEKGTIDLGTPTFAKYNLNLQSSAQFAADWRPRFAEAYRLQNQAWINAIMADRPDPDAASAWDGYCATVTGEAGVAALESGARVKIELADKPELYDSESASDTWEGAV